MKDSDSSLVRVPAPCQAGGLGYNIQHLSDLSKHFHLFHIRARASCRSLALLIMLSSPAALRAAFDNDPLGSRWQAMAGAGVACSGMNEPLLQNPAGLIGTARWLAGTVCCQPFGLSELAAWQMVGNHSWKNSGIGVALQRFGGAAFNETMVALGFARAISQEFVLGLTLRHGQVAIQRYGSAGTLLCDIGGQLRCSKQFRAGFVVRNALAARIGRCNEPLPQVLQCGLNLNFSPAAALCVDLYKERLLPLELRCGAEQQLGERLTLRAGFTTASLRLAAGFALRLHSLSIEYGAMTHPWLGLSHQFALYYFFGQNIPAEEEGN
jgi:hypothetical protein